MIIVMVSGRMIDEMLSERLHHVTLEQVLLFPVQKTVIHHLDGCRKWKPRPAEKEVQVDEQCLR